jgi:hypothetical protein
VLNGINGFRATNSTIGMTPCLSDTDGAEGPKLFGPEVIIGQKNGGAALPQAGKGTERARPTTNMILLPHT